MMAARKAPPQRETDLYRPVHDYLAARGYTVRAEVDHCDVVARKGDDLIVVEMKRRISLDLLIQATRRQRISDSVYVAVPRSACAEGTRRWRGLRRLLRQLELGLIVVSRRRGRTSVEVLFHPLAYQRQKRTSARRAILEEMDARSANHNRGGSTRTKLLTAYRERAIHIACCLEALGPLAPRQLRAMGTGPKTQSVLYSDFYGWFRRVARGVYAVTARGRAGIGRYAAVASRYRREVAGRQPPP
jgi:hypothetical protein